jgi:23S rRNA (cytosine1962-C5)-methyltransferase
VSRPASPKPSRPKPPDAVVLRAGRERSVARRHPWIFSGAIAHVGGALDDGSVVEVHSADGQRLGHGLLNRRSQITVRMLTWGDIERPDPGAWIQERLARALAARPSEGARRLVHAESDDLPGLVVDRYADFLVVQISTLGLDRQRETLVAALQELAAPKGIYERSEGEARKKEGLAPTTGVLAGEPPPDVVEIAESTSHGPVRLLVDVRRGHKTGAYLDQRINRRRVAAYAQGGSVLNVFSYTGGFGLHAARAGASRVVNVDASADALALSERSAEINGWRDRMEHLRGDAFTVLRDLREAGSLFDLVILDPPKFVDASAHLKSGTKGYNDINRVAMHLVRPGGHLATFSCSGLVSANLFQKIVFSASISSGQDAALVERLGQPDDHPVRLSFPEGEYLKGMVVRAGSALDRR